MEIPAILLGKTLEKSGGSRIWCKKADQPDAEEKCATVPCVMGDTALETSTFKHLCLCGMEASAGRSANKLTPAGSRPRIA